MLNKILSFKRIKPKPLTILIVEPRSDSKAFLGRVIELKRPYHEILAVNNWEQVFSLIYSEVTLDLIFFDIETEKNTNNLKMIRAVSPSTAFIHWSNCKHPEVIELLNELGVNSFCLKDSRAKTIIDAIDTVEKNPNILYVDERLNNCLPLLNV